MTPVSLPDFQWKGLETPDVRLPSVHNIGVISKEIVNRLFWTPFTTLLSYSPCRLTLNLQSYFDESHRKLERDIPFVLNRFTSDLSLHGTPSAYTHPRLYPQTTQESCLASVDHPHESHLRPPHVFTFQCFPNTQKRSSTLTVGLSLLRCENYS